MTLERGVRDVQMSVVNVTPTAQHLGRVTTPMVYVSLAVQWAITKTTTVKQVHIKYFSLE